MHGLGNDFMVVDNRAQLMELDSKKLTALADRKTGIGFDQLLLVENPRSADSQFKYRIFNADGAEVNQCGNGARCFARYVLDKGLVAEPSFWVETNAGRIQLIAQDDGQVSVNMGVPRFTPEHIPLSLKQRAQHYELVYGGDELSFMAAEIGNPHAVFQLGPVAQAPVEQLGAFLQTIPLFPERVNVGFMHIISEDEIDLRVFERGVGETRACGSGACAAAAVGVINGLLNENVKVNLLGGSLTIDYAGEGQAIFLTGPASTVYHGELIQ